MHLKHKIVSIIVFTTLVNFSAIAGVYTGSTDEATFNQLLVDVSAKQLELEQKIIEAESLGLNTEYAQVSVVTVKLFKDTFAPWDKSNNDQVQQMYAENYFSRFDPVGAQALPFDELADSIEVAEAAIAQLQQQIDGEIVLQAPPIFSEKTLVLNGDRYELDGKKVVASKFFWQPADAEIMRAFGSSGESYYSVQDLEKETSLRPYRYNNFMDNLQQEKSLGRSPVQFFLGHIVPQNFWLRGQYPKAFEKGHRLFTDYDIDHPSITTWFDTLFSAELAKGIELLGDVERVHMIANEPTFSIREGGEGAERGVSDYTLSHYQDWLENKYSNIASLNTVYGQAFSNFSEVVATYTIPLSLSLQGGAAWYDWNRFNMDRVNDWFSFLHDSIHAFDNKAQTHVKIMGERAIHTPYHDEGLDFEFITKLVDMPGSDNQTTSFAAEWDLRFKQGWRERYSLEWRAQAIMLDFVKSIAPNKLFYDSEWHGLSGARWRDFHMSPEYVRSTLWLAATQGLGALTTWVWNRKADGSIDNRADFVGTSVTQPIQLDAYGRTIKELNAHGNAVADLVPQSRYFMLYFNQNAAIQDPTYTEQMADVYEALKLLNVPMGFTTPAELSKLTKQQTVVISPTEFIADEDLAALRALSQSGGNIVLFNSTSSFGKSEIGKARNDNTLSTLAALEYKSVLAMADELKVALTSVTPVQSLTLTVKNAAGEPVYGVLSNQFFDGNNKRQIISLVNTSQQRLTVSLYSQLGQVSDVVNLIDGQMSNGQFNMPPMDVKLLSVDANFIQTIAVTGISVPVDRVSVKIGESQQVSATVLPENANNTNLIWTSQNLAYATVSSGGNVLGIAPGNTVVEVSTEDGNFSHNISVEVLEKTVGVLPPTDTSSNSSGGTLMWLLLMLIIYSGRKWINE